MFNVGDVVQLKSGGPAMTVEHVYGSGGAADVPYSSGLLAKDDVFCILIFEGQKAGYPFRKETLDKIS